MKTCPNCLSQVVDEAKFCNKCGFDIKAAEEQSAFCIECGAKLENGSLFCIQCGKKQLQVDNNSFSTFDFSGLEKEAKKQLKENEEEEKRKAELAKWEVGKIYILGSYYQSNGIFKEPVEWIVLARSKNKALLISKYVLDCKQYNEYNVAVSWETCTLRKWLNKEFLNATFNEKEQGKIQTTCIQNPGNLRFNISGGNATDDKIFLLSIEEAEEFFKSDSERMYKLTDYAALKDTYQNDRGVNCWLRSPGYILYNIAEVQNCGKIHISGSRNLLTRGIRPAMWIEL